MIFAMTKFHASVVHYTLTKLLTCTLSSYRQTIYLWKLKYLFIAAHLILTPLRAYDSFEIIRTVRIRPMIVSKFREKKIFVNNLQNMRVSIHTLRPGMLL